MDGRIALLLRLLDQSYDNKAWHGTNLRGSLRGLTPGEAAWRPAPGRHNIWEIAVHAAYWKYAVQRRLSGAKRGSFVLKGSNWFPRQENLTPAAWKVDLKILEETHRHLYRTVADLPPSALRRKLPGSSSTVEALIYGVASHDVYHAGQIQLLKRLQANTTAGRSGPL